MRRSTALALLILSATVRAAIAGAPPEVAVTTCGQIIPNRTIGYLTGNLDCTGFTGTSGHVYGQAVGATVLLGRKSELDLRGFTLTAGRTGVVCDGLICGDLGEPCSVGPCQVYGGTIVSAGSDVGVTGVRPVLHDLTIEGGFNIGVVVYGKGVLTNVTVTGCNDNGVQGSGGLGKRTFGLLKVVDSTITGNARFGVFSAKALTVTSSIVTGNGSIAPDCIATRSCGDIESGRKPHLKATTCDHSVGGPDGSWGVCALD